MIINMLGYSGMIIVIISLLLKERYMLHIVNLIGSINLLVYAWLITSTPYILLNVFGIVFNCYQLKIRGK